MKLDAKLNLIIPLVRDDGSTIYVHSTPISEDVFEIYYEVIWKAFCKLFMVATAAAVITGPKVAFQALKRIAIDDGVWDGEGGVQGGLMAEIYRLSNVVMPGPDGWATLPLQHVLNQKVISDSEFAEARGQIVFFILTSAMFRKSELAPMLLSMAATWRVRVECSSCMELVASLPTSTPGEPSASSEIPGAIPSRRRSATIS